MVRRICIAAVLAVAALALPALPAFAGGGTLLTLTGPQLPVRYPKAAQLKGVLTTDGSAPAAWQTVKLGTTSGGIFTPVVSATTGADGSYSAAVKPTVNATWTARWGDVAGDQIVVQVAPRVSLALSHIQSALHPREIFTGRVTPEHAGMKVLVQRVAPGGTWRTVASGRLDERSRFHIVWRVPPKSARYKLRAVLPAHADHALGTSVKANLTVVFR